MDGVVLGCFPLQGDIGDAVAQLQAVVCFAGDVSIPWIAIPSGA